MNYEKSDLFYGERLSTLDIGCEKSTNVALYSASGKVAEQIDYSENKILIYSVPAASRTFKQTTHSQYLTRSFCKLKLVMRKSKI